MMSCSPYYVSCSDMNLSVSAVSAICVSQWSVGVSAVCSQLIVSAGPRTVSQHSAMAMPWPAAVESAVPAVPAVSQQKDRPTALTQCRFSLSTASQVLRN